MSNLEDLKAGEQAIITDRYGPCAVVTIERVTKTQIIATRDRRFNRRTGRPVGADTWNAGSIEPLTTANQRAYRLRKLKEATRTAMYEADTALRNLQPDPAVVSAHLKTAAAYASQWTELANGDQAKDIDQ